MPLDSSVSVALNALHTSALDFSTVSAPLSRTYSTIFTSGTGAGAADRIFADQRTITASGTDDLDLAGSLTDSFGATITFARIKVLFVAAAAGNTNNVLVGGAASAQFINWVSDATDKIVVRPGGEFLLKATDATAYAVTATSGDLLRIANSAGGTSVTYDIVLIGASA